MDGSYSEVRGVGSSRDRSTLDASPVLSVDLEVVWVLEDLVELFLIFLFSSQGVGLCDGERELDRVDEAEFVVGNIGLPTRRGPGIDVFFTVCVYELVWGIWGSKESNFVKFHLYFGLREVKSG